MSEARTIYNLAVAGFMGTGKSVVGRLAAEQLRFDFIDTDDWIERETGKTIPEIFASQGEPAFRQFERATVEALRQCRNTVIATGGGLVIDPANMTDLKTHALVVCLWASPEKIWERVRAQTHRPLLQAPDPLGRIRALLEQRGPAYRQADVLVNTGCRSARQVAQQIVHQFQLAQKQP